ncbi:MAG: HEAT repeat domain-containing protein [Anaerolineales bacterium]|nr:HEAT repeat domain-containing protein [Chloroflexota bacterium]MBL6981923.1 HEAT repeat domain-containing protein [Anaerolineales bacterium]
MNKSQIRELLGNLKAAARLGHPAAVEIALDDLRAVPIIAANDHLSEGHLDQLVYPVGDILARLPASHLRQLLEDQFTALRAVAGVALAKRFLTGKEANQKMLFVLAKDTRPEVRTALGETLRKVGEAHPEHLLHLVESWLRDSSPKVRATALVALPAMVSSQGEDVIKLLEPLKADEDRDVRAAMVKALQAIAQKDVADLVLTLLTDWSTAKYPNTWVITRTLSGSWAVSHPLDVETILSNLHAKFGKTKNITNALRALERHGLLIKIES